MDKQKFTCNTTFVFYAKDYADAQRYVIEKLSSDQAVTHMVIQRCDLIGWTDPATGKPVTESDDNL